MILAPGPAIMKEISPPGAGTDEIVLGPFAAGLLLIGMHVQLEALDSTVLTIAASITQVAEATAAALAAGRPLIIRGSTVTAPAPPVVYSAAIRDVFDLDIPIGQWVRGSPLYIAVRVAVTGAAAAFGSLAVRTACLIDVVDGRTVQLSPPGVA